MLFETMDSDHNTLKVGVQLNPEEVQILENIKANKKVVESLPNMNINWRIVNNTWDDVATEYPSKGCQLSSNEEDELNKAYHELQHKPLISFLRRCSSSSIDGDKISKKKDELSKAHHELQHKPVTSLLRKSSSNLVKRDKISKKKDELSKTHHELKSKPVTSFLGKSSSLGTDKRDEIQSSSVTINQSLLYLMNSNVLNTSVNANIKTNTAA
mmetsp:Transcript_28714/g.35029  ORF Transcript_28714/g.35029 Transcript_28714/m.35029 type:complete len:213 (+) Transcript_28714:110-748(+)